MRDGAGLIGVGFDGSPESHAALELAHELAKAAGARLRVIDVVVPARIPREQAEERLSGVLAELGDIATGDVAFGSPARELAYEGNYLDLLVAGSRGYGPVRRLMLGSTSSKLVHEAPCPVLVLARGAEQQSDDVHAASAAAPVAP